MHLLVISGFWPTEGNSISGIFVVQQVAAFARAGARVNVIVPRTIGRGSAALSSARALGLNESEIRLVEVPVLRLPEQLSSLPGAIQLNTMLWGLMLGRAIRRLSRTHFFDGCVVHGARYGGLSLPFWRKEIRGNAAIVVHGVDPLMVVPGNQRRARSLFCRAGEVSDAVVLVGQPLKAHAEFLGFPANKLQVVPNGTDLPSVCEGSAKRRARAQVRRVVSVSNLVPLKGVDDNLRALAAIAKQRPDLQWEYRVVGDGPYRGELEKLAVQLGIAPRVEFLGRVAYDETMQQIAQCDVFSLPSWGEAFGIVYLEAMARMRPVIGCFDNGAEDIFTDGVEGRLVPPKDVPALAAALTQLLDDPALCAEMGEAGRATAETMSWDANAKQMLGLLGARDAVTRQ